jgi:hypothetical protein
VLQTFRFHGFLPGQLFQNLEGGGKTISALTNGDVKAELGNAHCAHGLFSLGRLETLLNDPHHWQQQTPPRCLGQTRTIRTPKQEEFNSHPSPNTQQQKNLSQIKEERRKQQKMIKKFTIVNQERRRKRRRGGEKRRREAGKRRRKKEANHCQQPRKGEEEDRCQASDEYG